MVAASFASLYLANVFCNLVPAAFQRPAFASPKSGTRPPTDRRATPSSALARRPDSTHTSPAGSPRTSTTRAGVPLHPSDAMRRAALVTAASRKLVFSTENASVTGTAVHGAEILSLQPFSPAPPVPQASSTSATADEHLSLYQKRLLRLSPTALDGKPLSPEDVAGIKSLRLDSEDDAPSGIEPLNRCVRYFGLLQLLFVCLTVCFFNVW